MPPRPWTGPTSLRNCLPGLKVACQVDAVVALRAVAGHWTVTARSGDHTRVPRELLAETMDREEIVVAGVWAAAPLQASDELAEVLAVRGADSARVSHAVEVLRALMGVVRSSLVGLDARLADRRRVDQLEAMLRIANQWNHTREVAPLLEQMAAAATRLLKADRASIFLWDRRTKTLVGRPALGVEDGELRVPDDRGVVGQVVRTGQSLRVDSTTEPERINRQVDESLGMRLEPFFACHCGVNRKR